MKKTVIPGQFDIVHTCARLMHKYDESQPRDEKGRFAPTGAQAYFDAVGNIPKSDGIEAAEVAWAGGLADTGDPEAARLIQAMPGYFDYRSAIEDAARKHLGDTFTAYRLMAKDQYDEWKAGTDMPPVAVSLSRDVANSFRKLAVYQGRKDLVLSELKVAPEAIVMAGKPEEQELVIDGNSVSAADVRLLKYDPDQARDEHGRWVAEGTKTLLSYGEKFGTNRAANVKLAVEAFKAIGLPARTVSKNDPAHIREGIKKRGGAWFWKNPDTNQDEVVVNQYSTLWADPKKLRAYNASDAVKRFSSDHPAGTLVHEWAHYVFNEHPDAETHFANDLKFKEEVKKHVGTYAATSSREFAAEVYTGLQTGRTYPQSIIDRYNSMVQPNLWPIRNKQKAEFDESQHPRDERGRFAEAGGSSVVDAALAKLGERWAKTGNPLLTKVQSPASVISSGKPFSGFISPTGDLWGFDGQDWNAQLMASVVMHNANDEAVKNGSLDAQQAMANHGWQVVYARPKGELAIYAGKGLTPQQQTTLHGLAVFGDWSAVKLREMNNGIVEDTFTLPVEEGAQAGEFLHKPFGMDDPRWQASAPVAIPQADEPWNVAKEGPQNPQTATPAFKAWFKDSKVVAPSGEPLVAYHGSLSAFDEFRTTVNWGEGKARRAAWLGELGSWFAAPSGHPGEYDPENAAAVASDFVVDPRTDEYKAGAQVYPVYLSIKNPVEFEDYEDLLDDIESEAGGSVQKYRSQLHEAGHDGIVIRGSTTDGNVFRDDWVAFEPGQIKSAIGNTGAFDPTSTSITKADFDESQHPRDEKGRFSSAGRANSPEFRAWFGDSRVIGRDGTPKVLYRGQSFDHGDVLKPSKGLEGWLGEGVYLTEKLALAESYAGGHGNITPVYARIEKPFEIDLDSGHVRYPLSTLVDSDLILKNGVTEEAVSRVTQHLKDAGYDGVIAYYGLNGKTGERAIHEAVVFDPAQVKSSIGNVGTYHRETADITKADFDESQHPRDEKGRFTLGSSAVEADIGLARALDNGYLRDLGSLSNEQTTVTGFSSPEGLLYGEGKGAFQHHTMATTVLPSDKVSKTMKRDLTTKGAVWSLIMSGHPQIMRTPTEMYVTMGVPPTSAQSRSLAEAARGTSLFFLQPLTDSPLYSAEASGDGGFTIENKGNEGTYIDTIRRRLEKVLPVSTQKAEFSEEEHPRHPAGSPEGGQFAPKDSVGLEEVGGEASHSDWNVATNRRMVKEYEAVRPKLEAHLEDLKSGKFDGELYDPEEISHFLMGEDVTAMRNWYVAQNINDEIERQKKIVTEEVIPEMAHNLLFQTVAEARGLYSNENLYDTEGFPDYRKAFEAAPDDVKKLYESVATIIARETNTPKVPAVEWFGATRVNQNDLKHMADGSRGLDDNTKGRFGFPIHAMVEHTELWDMVQGLGNYSSRQLTALTKATEILNHQLSIASVKFLPEIKTPSDEFVKKLAITTLNDHWTDKVSFKEKMAFAVKNRDALQLILPMASKYIPEKFSPLTAGDLETHGALSFAKEKAADDYEDDPQEATKAGRYAETQRVAKALLGMRAAEVLKERGIEAPPPVVNSSMRRLWRAWLGSSTSDGGVAIQKACADEFGGRFVGDHIEAQREMKLAEIEAEIEDDYRDIGGMKGVQALMRATWETSQFVLEKAGIENLGLYRAVGDEMLPKDWKQQEIIHNPPAAGTYLRPGELLADGQQIHTVSLQKNGAMSTSMDREVSNNWGSTSGDRLVIRMDVPRSAILSVPAFGKNDAGEHEVVVLGTAWNKWDLWYSDAPSFAASKILKENTAHYPAGSPDGKGGQFAPKDAEGVVEEPSSDEDLHPSVVNVGGDAWNRETAVRLEKEYKQARPEIESVISAIIKENEGDGNKVPNKYNDLPSEVTIALEQSYTKEHYEEMKATVLSEWLNNRATTTFFRGVEDVFDKFHSIVMKGDILSIVWNGVTVKDGQASLKMEESQWLIDAINEQFASPLWEAYRPQSVKEWKDWARVLTSSVDINPHGANGHFFARNQSTEPKFVQFADALTKVTQRGKESYLAMHPTPPHLETAISIEGSLAFDVLTTEEKQQYLAAHEDLVKDIPGYYKERAQEPKTWDPIGRMADKDNEARLSYLHTGLVMSQAAKTRAVDLISVRNPDLAKSLGSKATLTQWVGSAMSELWGDWLVSSTSTSGRILQYACAQEFGGRNHTGHWPDRDENNVKSLADMEFRTVGGFEGVKAIMRATWEVSQYALEKAGEHDLALYRAVGTAFLPDWKAVPEDGAKLEDVTIARNGAMSTTAIRRVANDWGSTTGDRIVLRMEVPRTAVLSVPAYGKNEAGEHEVVIVGTAWKKWDAWYKTAPDVTKVPISKMEKARAFVRSLARAVIRFDYSQRGAQAATTEAVR